ncbi:White collar 1 [Hyphodiscus hymeniophilus]|uniref:White collar 1 n=1 Tax=Hyphodiscus hymeniophilus TaxID=353542 RepID=A0A9P6VGC7_9HELO|nr:White collar 1 [Hyphodiscus hymeniophilus]
MGPPDNSTMDMGDITGGGDSLDDIIMQNNKELQRRQSQSRPYAADEINRRSSIMEFGGSNERNLNGFQFQPTSEVEGQGVRRQSAGDLEMVTGYADMSLGMSMQGPQMGFTSTMQTSEPLTVDTVGYPGISPDMVQGMMGYGPMGMEAMTENDGNLNMYSPVQFSQGYGASLEPMPDFMLQGTQQDPMRHDSMHEEQEELVPTISNVPTTSGIISNSTSNMNVASSMVDFNSPVSASIPPPMPSQEPAYSAPPETPTTSAPDIEIATKLEPKSPNYQNIYSSSGFDMLGALMKVATRNDPEINIGKVDMSCAFVVCDITQPDIPIIYVSDIFERLTGYSKHEVLGRNCRFLQSPEGKVQAGAPRQFVDSDPVWYLKQRVLKKKEAQRSLINYRKGGQPFMNLLTMIPITGEDDIEIKYYVGLQVDLLANPSSVESKNAGGLYTINYSQSKLPQYVWHPPDRTGLGETGQTISRDDVSTVLGSINSNTESELTKRMWDKVLLENTDDVVHVLSLKGLFLYLSPSSRKVLEYDASELVGTALSSVCHPSDIVPVTRELKDTSTGASVNVVFRIRRKKSGYTWFESHGSLAVEQGKGRKCIILVGRERPVYALSRQDIDAAGGIGENEMWTKLSTSGMCLFASSSVRTLLDRSPEELVGTSIQALMRSESKVEFGRSLEKARTGMRVTHKHEVLNKRGLVLQAQTTLYPGDAAEGSKPTFLVAQTRLLKASSRPISATLESLGNSTRSVTTIGQMDPKTNEIMQLSHSPTASSLHQDGELTPKSSVSVGPITHAGGAGLPIGSQDMALASEDNIFDELKTTRCTSWQFELRQMEKSNRLLAEELASLLSNKKKRKRRKGAVSFTLHINVYNTNSLTPLSSQTGRVSPRTSTRGGDGSKASQKSNSPNHSSPLANEMQNKTSLSNTPNLNPAPKTDRKTTDVGTAVPGSLGGRSTVESLPVHKPSQGFRDGGERGITNIDEEGSAGAAGRIAIPGGAAV